MTSFHLDCGKCRKKVSIPLAESSLAANCPECGARIEVEAFPALLKKTAPGQAGEVVVVDDQSSCFFHPAKKAAVTCEGCGRFLCSLCDIEMNGQHLCSTCIERGAAKGKLEHLQTERVRYDDITLFLSIVPLLVFWVTIITAPAALYMTLRYWKKPGSLLHRSRWRFIIASIFALLQVGGWGYLGGKLFMRLF
jgi:ribosomal protein S27E